MYSFGVNTNDAWQLGQGYEKNVEVIPQPTPIPGLTGVVVRDAAVGWGHTIAITGTILGFFEEELVFFIPYRMGPV